MHVSSVCFYFQPCVCHPAVLCVVPSEEVSERFKLDCEEKVLIMQILRCIIQLNVFDALTPAFLPPSSSSMSVSGLEPELQEKIRANHPGVERVYFNKGL